MLERIIEILIAAGIAASALGGPSLANDAAPGEQPPIQIPADPGSDDGDDPSVEDPDVDGADDPGKAVALARLNENLARLRAWLANLPDGADGPAGPALERVAEQAPQGLERAIERVTLGEDDDAPEDEEDEGDEDVDADDGPPPWATRPDGAGPPPGAE